MKKEIVKLEGTYITLANPRYGDYYLNIKHKKEKQDSYNILSILFDKTSLDGPYGINSIIDGIKNVQVRLEEYQEKVQEESLLFDETTEEGLEQGQEFWKSGKLRAIDLNRGYDWDCPISDDYKYRLYYQWGSETTHADSFSDITKVVDIFSYDEKRGEFTQVEYYSTHEVLEVLKKWKEALEKWNTPEERARMIQEYENGQMK